MSYKLLIVDDDTDLLSILGEIFSEEGYVVNTCSDGMEAIAKCREISYDLIIADIMLPGATGIEILREVRKIRPETMVILITGYASLETAINAIREGAYDYITKPFKLEQIKLAARNAFEKIALINENKQLLKKLEKAYEELHLVKQIIGANGSPDERSNISSENSEKTLISNDLTPLLITGQVRQSSESFVNDLERISTLRDKGLITTREFEICKAKLFQNLR